jgi:phospholipase/lecithinase/hemolysin
MNSTTAPQLIKIVALLSIVLCPSLVSAQVPQYDCLFAFGDSLADDGNILIGTRALRMNPPVPPSATPHRTYFEGRFSNGYIGVEYLWQRLSGHQPGSALGLKAFLASPDLQKSCAVDFAFGGTGTPYLDQTPGGFWAPGLKGQVELLRAALRGRKPATRSLYAIATGANDYRDDPFNVPMNPEHVVRNIEDAIVSLYRLGARDVMVLDLPDLGLIPGNGGDPNATLISRAHNKALYAAVARLRGRFPQLRLILVELDPLFNQLRDKLEPAAPALVVFAPTQPGLVACLFTNPASCTDAPPALFNAFFGFLFWDIVHPTTETHKYLADYMYDQLAAEYE